MNEETEAKCSMAEELAVKSEQQGQVRPAPKPCGFYFMATSSRKPSQMTQVGLRSICNDYV